MTTGQGLGVAKHSHIGLAVVGLHVRDSEDLELPSFSDLDGFILDLRQLSRMRTAVCSSELCFQRGNGPRSPWQVRP